MKCFVLLVFILCSVILFANGTKYTSEEKIENSKSSYSSITAVNSTNEESRQQHRRTYDAPSQTDDTYATGSAYSASAVGLQGQAATAAGALTSYSSNIGLQNEDQSIDNPKAHIGGNPSSSAGATYPYYPRNTQPAYIPSSNVGPGQINSGYAPIYPQTSIGSRGGYGNSVGYTPTVYPPTRVGYTPYSPIETGFVPQPTQTPLPPQGVHGPQLGAVAPNLIYPYAPNGGFQHYPSIPLPGAQGGLGYGGYPYPAQDVGVPQTHYHQHHHPPHGAYPGYGHNVVQHGPPNQHNQLQHGYRTLDHSLKTNTNYNEDGHHVGAFQRPNIGYGGALNGYNGAYNTPGF